MAIELKKKKSFFIKKFFFFTSALGTNKWLEKYLKWPEENKNAVPVIGEKN